MQKNKTMTATTNTSKFTSMIALIVALFLTSMAHADVEKPISSKIKHVNVYQSSARVARTASVNIPAGNSNIILQGLTTKLDANSIQVKGTGKFVLMSVKYQPDFLNKNTSSEKAKKLQTQIDDLQDQKQKLMIERTVLAGELNLLNINNNISSNQQGVTSIELAKLTSFYRTKRTEIDLAIYDKDQKGKKLQKQITDLKRQKNELNRNSNKPSGSIVVAISSKIAQSITLDFDYIVYNAGWTPYYDVRASESSDKVQLGYKAKIHQNTDIDWDNVLISVSTGNPSAGGTKPNLNTWYVRNGYAEKDKAYKYGKKANRAAPTSYADDDDWGDDAYVTEEEELEEIEPAANYASSWTTVSESALATTFDIALKQTIPSDNKEYNVDIQRFDVKSSFVHASVPKLDKGAFLMAQLVEWESLNLLSGDGNVFYDGSFVGNTYLDLNNTSDTLDVSLGRDQKVVVTRDKIKDFCKTRTIGTNIKKTTGYEIVVRNTKKDNITIEIEDQYPVSSNSEIEVSLLEKSGAKDEGKGKLKWTLELKPGETKKLQLKFEVKYQKKTGISGL